MERQVTGERNIEEKIDKIKKLIEITTNLMNNESDKKLKLAFEKRIEKQYDKLAKYLIFKEVELNSNKGNN